MSSSPTCSRGGLSLVALAAAGIVSAASAAGPQATELAPVPKGGLRIQAVAALSGGGALPVPCLTPRLLSARRDPGGQTAAARRALAALSVDAPLPGERRFTAPDGTTVRYTVDRGALDRVDASDDDGNGLPDGVDTVLSALARAENLLTTQLELGDPGPAEIVLARLGSGIDGFETSTPDGRPQIWLEANPREGSLALRRAAEHQYAHAVGQASGLDPAWGEAFAVWAGVALEGVDDRSEASLAHRLAAAGAGLDTDDLDLAAGNAAWFAFLNEAYGSTAVKLTVEELGAGGPRDAALDRAVRRAAGDSLDQALRDYQLWSLLVGSWDDRRHFSFASRLPSPAFAATADSLPALSVQADPDLAPLGTAAVLLRPDARTGGMAIRFEGDMTARWGADVLVVRSDGSMQRVPVALDENDAGDVTLPLQDLREAVLLVRNLDATGHASHRYTWIAHLEPGYPAEIDAVRVEPASTGGGVIVSWETTAETGVIGFNVLRSQGSGSAPARINPVWIPAVGSRAEAAGYSFLDATAEPGAAYRYRVEAITPDGLASRTAPVAYPPAD